jgi:hypothetical protein
MLTSHALLRRDERLSDRERELLAPRLDRACELARDTDVAFVSEDLGRHRAEDGSNGDRLVVVVRFGSLITLQWRRNSQAFTPEKFRVRRVQPLP